MNHGDLWNYIAYKTNTDRYDNYQVVMIKTLLEKNGRTSKSMIISELEKENPQHVKADFAKSYVFDLLTEHGIVEFDKKTNKYELLDHGSLSRKEKNHLVDHCKACIKAISDIESMVSDFQSALKLEYADYAKKLETERRELVEIMKRLSTTNEREEFTNLVWYGLLPSRKSKKAERVSMFASMITDIQKKPTFADFSKKDYDTVAKKIYSLASKFEAEPDRLDRHIKEFVSGKYAKGIQSGTISPILFCLNKKFPLVNNPARRTYENLAGMLGWDDKLERKLEGYMDNKKKCQKLIKFLNVKELKDLDVFAFFCKWFDDNDRYMEYDGPEEPPPEGPVDGKKPGPYSIRNIVKEGCFVEEWELKSIMGTLESKKNLILQGPPGTGKTYLAKKLAYALVGSMDDPGVHKVQFHPNLSYEDFVIGWRPGGGNGLELAEGHFLKLIDEARDNPDRRFVMIIEEINRGNPANIFGEMLTLLEADKRNKDEAMMLSYARNNSETVYVPKNLYVIGTMNVADRSIALMDLALRRRFGFFDLEPIFDNRWENWMHENCGISRKNLNKIRDRMESLNDTIEKDELLGPHFKVGHSYVTPNGKIDDAASWFKSAVKNEIGPLLDEYWAEKPQVAKEEKEKLLRDLRLD